MNSAKLETIKSMYQNQLHDLEKYSNWLEYMFCMQEIWGLIPSTDSSLNSRSKLQVTNLNTV